MSQDAWTVQPGFAERLGNADLQMTTAAQTSTMPRFGSNVVNGGMWSGCRDVSRCLELQRARANETRKTETRVWQNYRLFGTKGLITKTVNYSKRERD